MGGRDTAGLKHTLCSWLVTAIALSEALRLTAKTVADIRTTCNEKIQSLEHGEFSVTIIYLKTEMICLRLFLNKYTHKIFSLSQPPCSAWLKLSHSKTHRKMEEKKTTKS